MKIFHHHNWEQIEGFYNPTPSNPEIGNIKGHKLITGIHTKLDKCSGCCGCGAVRTKTIIQILQIEITPQYNY